MDALILAIQNYIEKEDFMRRHNESKNANNELNRLFNIIIYKSLCVKIKNHDLSLLIQQERKKRYLFFNATGM